MHRIKLERTLIEAFHRNSRNQYCSILQPDFKKEALNAAADRLKKPSSSQWIWQVDTKRQPCMRVYSNMSATFPPSFIVPQCSQRWNSEKFSTYPKALRMSDLTNFPVTNIIERITIKRLRLRLNWCLAECWKWRLNGHLILTDGVGRHHSTTSFKTLVGERFEAVICAIPESRLKSILINATSTNEVVVTIYCLGVIQKESANIVASIFFPKMSVADSERNYSRLSQQSAPLQEFVVPPVAICQCTFLNKTRRLLVF